MLRYYLDCEIAERQNAAYLLGLLFQAAHGFIVGRRVDSLALDWPEARFDDDLAADDGGNRPRRVRHPHPGGKLRVFAPDAALLQAFARWEGIVRLSRTGAVRVSEIRPAPEEPQGWRVWRRARSPERRTDAFVLRTEARFLRRLARRGVPPEEAASRAEARRLALAARAAETGQALFLRVRSQSTGQRLSFFIECHAVSAPREGRFNAYGLSSCATTPAFG